VLGWFDRARLGQLLDTLVENAIKYSPPRGELQVKVRVDAGDAHLSATDHGIGILLDDLPDVIEWCRRGTNVDDRRFAAMGIRLSMARPIAEDQGGQISAGSALGQSTTMNVWLPGFTSARPFRRPP
jgi:signal transduction histidine kinase